MTLLRKVLLVFALTCSQLASIKGSNIIEFAPINDRVLLVHFDDGYVVHHKRGESRWSNEYAVVNELDVELASQTGSYMLSGNKGRVIGISKIGRKSKPTEIALKMDGNNHAKEHWVYLFLDQPIQDGETITLKTPLDENKKVSQFVFDINSTRSEAIHVNQVGYTSRARAKYAYVSQWAGDIGSMDFSAYEGKPFYLINTLTGKREFSGKLEFRATRFMKETVVKNDSPNDNYSASEVWQCDFSAFNPSRTAEYRVAIEGIGCSFSFMVGADVLRPAFITLLRCLYHHRSGIELKPEYTDLPRPAAAHPLLTPGFEERMKYTARRNHDFIHPEDKREAPAILAELKGSINTYGFYQDAGDWDGYFTHLRVPLLLMSLYEIAPENFADSEANIPESGNGIPDILDEAAWLLRYFHRTRHALMNTFDSIGNSYGTGGAAGARVAGDFFGSDEKEGKSIPSWEDNHRDYVVSGESCFESYYYAGLAAQMAYILKAIGKHSPVNDNWKLQAYDENYDWTKIDWEREAQESYAWANNNIREGDESKGLAQYRFYAASTLYRLTGKNEYTSSLADDLAALGDISGNKTLYMLPYLTLNKTARDKSLYDYIVEQVSLRTYNLAAENSQKRAFRFGGDLDYPTLVGQATSPMVEEAIVGWYLTKNMAIFNGFATTADYVLGNNPLNICWPTRLGHRSTLGVFNMNYWGNGYLITEEKQGLLSGFDISKMVPGIVPYGPTAPGKSWISGNSPFSANWPDQFLYPVNPKQWPVHELWYDQWCAPPSAEYTVHQTIISSATIFGLLCDKHRDALSFKPVIPKFGKQ